MFMKIGALAEIGPHNIQAADSIPPIPAEVLDEMKKVAVSMKRIAPKADDFLYFSAVMMHAAEAALINSDGTPKLTRTGIPAQAKWEVSANGSWKWMSNDPSIRALKNCFPPGTHITMEDGSVKNIEEVQVGDAVITHTGASKKVLRTFITPHDGDLMKFSVLYNQSITCTDNHPIFIADPTASFKKTKASDIATGDLFLSPVLTDTVSSNLNPNRARVLGVYAAEGSFSKKYGKRQAVRFTIGLTETKQADLIASIFAEEFPECAVHINPEPSRSIIEITASGHNIADYFFYHCGEYSHEKKLSQELVFAAPDIKRAFLAGWLDGDGCLDLSAGRNKLIGITVSPHMANQIRLMLNSLQIPNAMRVNYTSKKGLRQIGKGKPFSSHDTYRLELQGQAYKALGLDVATVKYAFIDDAKALRKSVEFCGNYGLHAVKSIERVQYTGDVYNFEVEDDHSYIANGVVVSNCNGDIFPEAELIKAYKKWVGKPLCVDHKSASVDHVRGFIVDTYYDRDLKRVVALCALDRKNYPDLARKVETGYQNSVSMGTGVERAICYDCGTVARTEADFCHHMRTKTGYGEVNTGLNPIELSIVVNGADRDAKIKHIIAAVDTMNAYVEEKERDLQRLARHYSGQLNYNDEQSNGSTGQVTVQGDSIEALKASITKAIDDFAKLEQTASAEKVSEDGNNAAYTQSGSTVEMPETELPGTNISLSPPNARLAMTDDLQTKLTNEMATVKAKLAKLQQDLDKLATTNTNEDTMSGNKDLNKQGYFLGGGGLNEPTPGKVKYEIDPLNEEDRNEHDKQMVGQKPFPEVGPVDGMYPGYESFPSGELEMKKKLLRAEVEERQLRRNAVIAKAKESLGYFQNGQPASNPNSPTPGKVKYPIDKLNEEDRNQHDKQMVGQKPFPEVGAVDGLHPSPLSADEKDELKRKEKLLRAGLKAKFTKAADLSKSTWQVFGEDEKLLLSKTVDELTNGRSSELYAGIATDSFAKDLMSKIRTLGVEKVDSLYKKAQVPPPAPMGDAPAVPVGAAEGVDSGKEGDPKGAIVEMADKMADLASDMKEAVHTLVGEPAEMGDMPGAAADDSGSKMSTASMQNELSDSLQTALTDTASAMLTHVNELRSVARLYDRDAVRGEHKDFLTAQINETVSEAKQAFANGLELMGAYVTFAETVNSLEKRATTLGDTMQPENKEIMGMLGETEAGLKELASVLDEGTVVVTAAPAASSDESAKKDSASADDVATMLADDFAADDAEDDDDADDSKEDSGCADDNAAATVVAPDVATAIAAAKADPTVQVEIKKASKDERIALRTKLAEEMPKVSPIFYEFHPKGGHTPGAGDGASLKAQDELAKVEDIEEIHDKMMDVVHVTPKVKKLAEDIKNLIKAGELRVDQVDQLVAAGIDPAAVKYYKDFYGEMGPEGKSFATDLVKEHAKAQLAEEMATYRVKIARAFELAYDMREAGHLPDGDRSSLSKKVDEIMTWNDRAFESVKKIVAQHAPAMRKAASSLSVPQVSGQPLFTEEPVNTTASLRAELERAFAGSKPRLF